MIYIQLRLASLSERSVGNSGDVFIYQQTVITSVSTDITFRYRVSWCDCSW